MVFLKSLFFDDRFPVFYGAVFLLLDYRLLQLQFVFAVNIYEWNENGKVNVHSRHSRSSLLDGTTNALVATQ